MSKFTITQHTVIWALFSYPNAPRDCTHKNQNDFAILINRQWRKYNTRAVRQLIKARLIETWEDGFDLTEAGKQLARERFEQQ